MHRSSFFHKCICAIAFAVGAVSALVAGEPVTVRHFGVLPDPVKVNTVMIQAAIDSAASRGQMLVFGPGDYVSGTLLLPDNACIRLDSAARLLGSTNPYDYRGYADGTGMEALVSARGVGNIRITGPGTIDGRGLGVALAVDSLHHTGVRPDPSYNLRRMRPSLRPKLIDMHDVDNLVIDSLHLRASAAWGLSLNGCTDVVVRGIDFVNRAYWNNDGIDVADCRNVLIEGCYINSADDGIVLKSFDKNGGNDGVVIRDCDIRSSASALKFGTESYGAFRNVTVRDIRVRDTFRSAVALETVDGAVLENVLIDGVDAQNTGNALFMRLGHRNGDNPGAFRNVTVRNLSCTVPFGRPDEAYDLRGPDINVIHNPFPASITGIPQAHISGVTLENIHITYPGRGTKGMAYIAPYRYGDVPEAVSAYPEYSMFGELPAWGFYIRHVDGITFRNVTVQAVEPDSREAVVMDDVTGVDGRIDVSY